MTIVEHQLLTFWRITCQPSIHS